MKSNPRILVVDDKEANCYYLRALLEGAGFDVDAAAHGAEALEAARRHPPDLIVSDILMPVMDGFTFCRHCKTDPALRSIPFAFYTGTYTDERDRDFAFSLGAEAYILKPQEPDPLLQQFRELMHPGRNPSPPAPPAPSAPPPDDFLRQYSEALVRKLEDKMEQLEQELADRRKAETGQQAVEFRFRELFNHMTSGVAVYEALPSGEDFLIRDINRAGLDMAGLPRDAVVNRRVTDVFPGIRNMGFLDVLRRVWQTGNAERCAPARYEDPRLSHWYQNVAYKLPSGEVVAVYDNVTDQIHAQEASRASEARFQSFVENANDIVYSLSLDGRFIYVSPNWTEFLGHATGEVIGQPMADFIHPDDLPACLAALESARNGTKQAGVEYRVRHQNGSWRWHSSNGVFFPGGGGTPPSFLGISRDITMQKDAEAAREKLQAQMIHMQKLESVGRLAGGVAHDFNNMLQAILGHVELAMDQTPPEQPIYEDLQEIHRAAARSTDLTRQLLAFARKQTVTPRVIHLNETIESLVKMLRRLIGEHTVIDWIPCADPVSIRIDPSQISQILTNLCINARDAMPGGGTITVQTRTHLCNEDDCRNRPGFQPGRYVRLTVQDEGSGMDPEILINIFEPFFTTKDIGKGTGLGLATVYGIVKQNHGFIDVDSEPGGGTTFHVFLPLHEPRDADRPPDESTRPIPHGKETILLVEDELPILAIGTTMLRRMGYHVLSAGLPGEAIRLAEQHPGPIDLLITDVVMPEMDGRHLAKNILRIHPRIKRLFMSGYTADVIAHHGVVSDGIHFLEKPFTLATLSAKVREILDA
ncbi:MAG: response regulator [Lentisphaerae bacterium]|nr:response regulator [Lentisphaerota bacterium]